MSIQDTVKVWDSLVRLFHWSLVIGFTVAYLSGEDESALHINAGYVVLGLILFRLVWGFVGTKHARFADFIYRPSTVIDYTRDLLARRPQHYYGHNPLGGLMVIALLLGLLGTSVSGLALYAVKEMPGRWRALSSPTRRRRPISCCVPRRQTRTDTKVRNIGRVPRARQRKRGRRFTKCLPTSP